MPCIIDLLSEDLMFILWKTSAQKPSVANVRSMDSWGLSYAEMQRLIEESAHADRDIAIMKQLAKQSAQASFMGQMEHPFKKDQKGQSFCTCQCSGRTGQKVKPT